MLLSEYSYPCKYPFPLKSQLGTVRFMLRNKRGFILSEMGTAKTLSALWTCDFLYINNKIKKVLVIAPLSTIQSVWGDEIDEHLPHRKYSIVHHSNRNIRLRALDRDALFYLVNHDGIKTIEKELLAINFDIVIIDELTAYKTWSSKRTRCAARICRKPKAVWGMTGSPIANSPLDAYGQAKVVNPMNPDVPQYYTRFKSDIMTQLDMYTWIPKPGWEIPVGKMLSPAIKYKLRDCIDIPETLYSSRSVKMSDEQEKLYNEVYKHLLAEYKQGLITASNAGVKCSKLLQIASGAVYDEAGVNHKIECKPKLDALFEIYKETSNKKIIVFSEFRGALDLMNDFFKSKKVSVGMIHGKISKNNRTKVLNDFKAGKLDVLLLQPGTSAHGLTLVICHVVVWWTPALGGEKHEQAPARIIRPGQREVQLIIDLPCSKVERSRYTGLKEKKGLSTSLLNMFKEDS